MWYVDALVAALCCGLFAAAAHSVRRRLRSMSATPRTALVRPREEDLVRPTLDATGRTVWATQDELPWHEIVQAPAGAEQRRAG
jgi:hypothetical protein